MLESPVLDDIGGRDKLRYVLRRVSVEEAKLTSSLDATLKRDCFDSRDTMRIIVRGSLHGEIAIFVAYWVRVKEPIIKDR